MRKIRNLMLVFEIFLINMTYCLIKHVYGEGIFHLKGCELFGKGVVMQLILFLMTLKPYLKITHKLEKTKCEKMRSTKIAFEFSRSFIY